MKSIRVLLFIVCVFLLLGVGWFFFPAEGVKVGPLNLRFPSLAQAVQGEEEAVDVDAVIDNVNKSFEMTCSETLLDSMRFFRDYLQSNPNRIYLPNDNYLYFDTLFAQFEKAQAEGKVYRIMHYGDSQIEMDRISSVLRQQLQEFFGGSGPSMIPAIQTVPTISVSQQYANIERHALIGDASLRISNGRYGVLTQVGNVAGESSISFSQSNHSQAFEKAKQISRVSVLLGHNSQGFTASLRCDTIKAESKTLAACDSISVVSWQLPANVKRGTIHFSGNAEIYGVMLDGNSGIALDNVALRGCSGTIFTRIDEKLLRQSYDMLGVRMIILQFGGNRMPGITSTAQIGAYAKELEKQIQYLKDIVPQATLLFIGPSDMGKSYNGKMGTWKGLPELNDSLKAMTLRNEVAYWDMFHVMGGEGSMAQWVKHQPALAGPDYIHFTFTGAQEIGTQLAKSFTTYYDFYQLRQRVPSEKVIDFINSDRTIDSLRVLYRKQLPTYQPYKTLPR